MLPPRLIRRLVLAPLVIILAVGFLLLSPFLGLLALVFGLVARARAGHMRSLRLVGFVLVWFVAETAALVMLAGLWVVSGFGGRLRTEPYQSRHYGVMRWFLDLMYRGAERTYGLRVEIDEPEATTAELAARLARPVIVLSRARRARGLLPADPPAAERLPAAAAGGDEGDTAAGPQRGHRGQPAAERVDQAPADRREHLHPGDQAAGQRAGPGRRAGHLPRGRQLDPAPLAPGHPPAGAKGPSGPGRAGPGYAEPAPAADRRDPGGHLGLPGGGRDLRGPRRAGQHRHRGRCVEQIPDQPGHPGQVVAGAGRRGAA